MQSDVTSQLEAAAKVLDRLAPAVTLDEVLPSETETRRSSPSPNGRTPQIDHVDLHGKRSESPRRRRPVRIIAMTAAALMIVIGGLVALSGRDSGTERVSAPAASAPSATFQPSTRQPPAHIDLPADAMPDDVDLRFGAQLSDRSEIWVYDAPSTGQVCFVRSLRSGQSSGCLDPTVYAHGVAWAFEGTVGNDALLWGLTPPTNPVTVAIGDTSVSSDHNGLWFLIVPAEATQFTLITSTEQIVFSLVDSVPSTTIPDAAAPTVSAVPTPSSSLPLCNDNGCAGFDPLPVAPGVTDFYVGPADLGEPVVFDEFFAALTRCAVLSEDFETCEKIEGIAGVNIVSYPLDRSAEVIEPDASNVGVRIGTTFTDLEPADYAAAWGPTAAPGSRTLATVRGHPAIRYTNEVNPGIVWRERPGVLVWVTVPADRVDDLLTIAERVRIAPGPDTIPNRVIIPAFADPWDAGSNDGDGLLVATAEGQECVGLDYIDICGSAIDQRTIVRSNWDGTIAVAGSAPADVVAIRIAVVGRDPIEIATSPFADSPSLFYSTTIASGLVNAITWLDVNGNEIGSFAPTPPPAR